MTTQTAISLTSRDYQPLAPYSARKVGSSWEQVDREANAATMELVEEALVSAGFRERDGCWWGHGCEARIVARYRDSGTTVGVRVYDSPTLAAYHGHHLDGTYDALPVAEKHRLSGSPRPLVGWLRCFDQCGQARPGDGVR